MVNKISPAGIMGMLGGLLVALIINGCCPGHRYLAGGEEARVFTIEEAEFEGAFSKAMKTATEIGFDISKFSRSTGTFHARRGAGFTEVTEMDVFLEKEALGKLSLIIKIKSSKDHDKFIKEFLDAYGKYVKIILPHKPQEPTP